MTLNKIELDAWQTKLWLLDLVVDFFNSLYPYCTMCMNTSNYWKKCKPFEGYPHTEGFHIGKKHCYMKGVERK